MAGNEGPRRPHIIFLMADQLRSDLLGAYGSQRCPTPKLDILAQRSTLFMRHFTPCPLCVPARSSLMTGRSPHQHGAIIDGWLPGERAHGTINAGTELLPKRLLDAGYRVVHSGVQHVRSDPPFEQQLEGAEFRGHPAPELYHRELEQQRGLMLGDRWQMRDPVIDYDNGKRAVFFASSARTAMFPLREDLFYDSVVADHLIDAIRDHDGESPLALMGMFWLPHPPLWAPRQWAEMIDPYDVELPPTVGRWFKGMPPAQLANTAGQLGAHLGLDQWRRAWAMYMGMTALLDRCIGRVLAALDYAGMLEDSVIVFTSDHGEMLGSHRLFQKMCMYEPAVRVPLMVKCPGQRAQRAAWDLTQHEDLTEMLLDFAGASPMEGGSGRSLRSHAEGRATTPLREHVFATYDGNAGRGFQQRMARNQTHKLIVHGDDTPELYDLVEDPFETRNLAGRSELADVQRELHQRLQRWMAEQGDGFGQ